MPLDSTTIPVHITTEFRPPTELIEQKDVALPLLYEWHAKENPNYPVFTYHDGDHLEYITYSQVNRAIRRVARFVVSTVGSGHAIPPVIALLANTDSITYFVMSLGIMRAGCTILAVSVRNAAVAVADMMKRTRAGHIIISSDTVMRGIAKEALAELKQAEHNVVSLDLPIFDDLFAENLGPASPLEAGVNLPTTFDAKQLGFILHSSGSTGHPKPINWTYMSIARWGRSPVKGEVNLTGAIMGAHGIPMYHGFGSLMYCAAPTVGLIVAVFKPAVPPTVPTPDAVWQGMVDTRTDFSWGVPSFVEEWSRDPEKVLHMKQMRGIMFGGAALNEAVGNSLASKGVSLHVIYGCTEVGMVNNFTRKDPGMDWAYWAPHPETDCVFPSAGDGMHEVVIRSPVDNPLPKVDTTFEGCEAYATTDLVVPHPTKTGLWRIVGRADEQIVLSNGEKTNPIPLEKMINEDPHVKCSVMFGRGKLQNGVLIEPTEDYAIDPTDVKELEAYRNKIWPTIERMNAYAPQHSRVFKEMILLTSPSKPFEYTEKRQPRRKFVIQAYQDEIEVIYRELENSSQSEIDAPIVWDESSTSDFVRTVVRDTLLRDIGDDDDIFRNGGDSLQATYIRNIIMRALREANKDAAKRIPGNLVFAAPTISALAHVVYNAIHTDGPAALHSPADLWKHVERYSADLPARPKDLVLRPAGKEVVIITGTTGGFGCDTLEHLLRDEAVGKVYAFNRKNTGALERQHAQFKARGLDATLLDSEKFVMVEAVLHEHDFGLQPTLLEDIRTSVTHIMHNAWKVDFNMSIASFEVDMQGTRNLVDLALSSPYTQPPSIIFVSSIGTFANYNGPAPVPEAPADDPNVPFGSGYAESKWVMEHFLKNVAAKTDVHTIVMRLGQVAGDKLGYWNEREWFPSIVRSALFQRCLPHIDGLITWFPAYEAARAFTELRHSPKPFVHLIHPRPARWHAVMAPIAEHFNVPLVPYEQWVSALENSVEAGSAAEVEAMRENPALRIMPFFKGAKEPVEGESEAFGFVLLSTEKATEVSESLAQMPMLDAERAKMWLAAWKKSGFL